MVEFVKTDVANLPEPTYHGVSNPHPLYGKDPNVINEMGHTVYPKWVDGPDKDKGGFPIRVLVKDKNEEAKVTGKAWPVKKDGDK